MKNLLISLCFVLGSLTVYTQSFEGKGDRKLNLGYEIYGIGNGIKASFDYGLSDLFSIGAGTSVFFNDSDSNYFIYARTNVHLGIVWDFPPKFDIYPGIELGYLSEEAVGISGYIGFRYFITKKVGVFAELGNNGAAGLTFKV